MVSLKSPIGTNYRVDPDDLMNTKRTLNQLGYYDIPPHRGVDDWTDDAMFDGIKRFQKDNGLKVDGFMRPGGETEQNINLLLTNEQAGKSDTPQGNPNQRRIDFLESEIAKRREQVRQMQQAGADPKAIRDIEFGIRQSEAELAKLKGGGSWGPFSW